MPGTQANAIPIIVYKVLGTSDATPMTLRMPEKASLAIKRGTPVVVSSGYIIERTAIDGTTKVVAGISGESGHSLGSDGTAPIGGSGSTFGNVPNQASAVNVAIGSPPADGNIEVVLAGDDTIFVAKTDDAHTVAVTDIAAIYGLTKDTASGQWFVDTTITTAGGGACVEVTELVETGVVGGKVAFHFTRAYQQLFT